MATDNFTYAGDAAVSEPATRAVAIAPDDEADLAEVTRGIYIGVSGDVEVILQGDTEAVTFVAMAAGIVHPLRVLRVLEGTTATDLIGVY